MIVKNKLVVVLSSLFFQFLFKQIVFSQWILCSIKVNQRADNTIQQKAPKKSNLSSSKIRYNFYVQGFCMQMILCLHHMKLDYNHGLFIDCYIQNDFQFQDQQIRKSNKYQSNFRQFFDNNTMKFQQGNHSGFYNIAQQNRNRFGNCRICGKRTIKRDFQSHYLCCSMDTPQNYVKKSRYLKSYMDIIQNYSEQWFNSQFSADSLMPQRLLIIMIEDFSKNIKNWFKQIKHKFITPTTSLNKIAEEFKIPILTIQQPLDLYNAKKIGQYMMEVKSKYDIKGFINKMNNLSSKYKLDWEIDKDEQGNRGSQGENYNRAQKKIEKKIDKREEKEIRKHEIFVDDQENYSYMYDESEQYIMPPISNYHQIKRENNYAKQRSYEIMKQR